MNNESHNTDIDCLLQGNAHVSLILTNPTTARIAQNSLIDLLPSFSFDFEIPAWLRVSETKKIAIKILTKYLTIIIISAWYFKYLNIGGTFKVITRSYCTSSII